MKKSIRWISFIRFVKSKRVLLFIFILATLTPQIEQIIFSNTSGSGVNVVCFLFMCMLILLIPTFAPQIEQVLFVFVILGCLCSGSQTISKNHRRLKRFGSYDVRKMTLLLRKLRLGRGVRTNKALPQTCNDVKWCLNHSHFLLYQQMPLGNHEQWAKIYLETRVLRRFSKQV